MNTKTKEYLYKITWTENSETEEREVYARNAQDAQMQLNLIRNDVIVISVVNCDL
jgi:hypothetical protein